MSDHDDLDMLAAEFVLGTLEPEARADVKRRREREPELDQLIQAWENRLAPLGNEIDEIKPGPNLFSRIEQRLDELESTQHWPGETAAAEAQFAALKLRLRRWQWSTALASAASVLLCILLLNKPTPELAPQSFVAVFQHDDQQPAFMLSVDLQSRSLSITPVTAEAIPGRSYQLWIKADPLGPKPRSVGVLNARMEIDGTSLEQYDPALLKQATFGISLEPEGGSPTGQPTGPAIHGFLYPANPGQQSL
ncbi:anti-sigma factor [Marinobacterium mangrovicola]|uniref:Anti-sigma-K factor RskA n=1 Tax=Marinobacterium mangrovicola TaxID=1476959 RepID=A0A4R1GJ11_9GAMM|nr:anti-sigma factor [Marinobacterium mangrovicola]TCK08234.1 anti-sigma-K factor RskA [Marinobacterium mangrovicola]